MSGPESLALSPEEFARIQRELEEPPQVIGQLAMVLAEEGKRLSVEALTDQARADFDRIISHFIDAGCPFSADDLRYALDASQIPNRARGGLVSGALTRGLIREVGSKRSTHPATHNKRIGVYLGAAAAA